MKTSSTKGLIPAFLLITGTIAFLGIISLLSMRESSRAIDNVITNSRFVRLAKEGTINLAMAGQLPRDIEALSTDPTPLHERMLELQADFIAIKEKFEEYSLDERAPHMLAEFLRNGERYYEALARFFPLKEQMSIYTTHYKGETRTLVDVLSQRELDHVRYVRALRNSVNQKKLLVGTLDYQECGFFKWYNSDLPKHQDLARIIQDEMHPLHKNLHDYAALTGKLLAAEKYDEARAMLTKADADLVRLGNYFSGLRDLAYEEQSKAQAAFAAQVTELRNIYADAVTAANYLETHLVTIDLNPALAHLDRTTRNNRILVWLFTALGTMFSVLVAVTTYRNVRRRTMELMETTKSLHDTKEEIAENRNKLQHAFDEVSGLIQEVSRDQKFDIRFENPHLVKCYELMNCTETDCCCHGQEPLRCWQMVGTMCGGEVQGFFTYKLERCSNCPVFRHATADPVFLIGEHFNNMMTMLETKNKEIEELSITDPLTGLYNRRGFLSMGARQLGMAKRIKGELLLLYADLDNMKWINDTLGHSSGDLALVETADLLQETFRQTDIIGRLGGDEFAVLFFCETMDRPECEQTLLKRLWNNIDTCNNLQNRCYELSISVGVSWFDREHPTTIEKLLSEADRLMYEEKKSKKDSQ